MTRVNGVTFGWADEYVKRLKLVQNLAPGTIRKRVGALARVLDWHLRRSGMADQVRANPLRLLGVGYSQYTADESKKLALKKLKPKHDVQRDHRLAPGEESRVLWALLGGKREDRERGLTPDPAQIVRNVPSQDRSMRLRQGDHQGGGLKGRQRRFKASDRADEAIIEGRVGFMVRREGRAGVSVLGRDQGAPAARGSEAVVPFQNAVRLRGSRAAH